MRLASDVLAGARTERVVERGLVGVDVEVDRLGLGHPEQLGGVVDPVLADRQRALPEAVGPLVPVDPDDGPASVFQSNRVSAYRTEASGPST